MQTTIKDRVDMLKTKYHMTNAELSHRLHISEATFNNYMKNPDAMTYGTIKLMCKTLSCPVEYLLDGRDSEEKYKGAVKFMQDVITHEMSKVH